MGAAKTLQKGSHLKNCNWKTINFSLFKHDTTHCIENPKQSRTKSFELPGEYSKIYI